MKIIIENSTWNNLGDGFYQTALLHFMEGIFPNHNFFTGDGPIERAFFPNKRQYNNALKSIEFQKADLHIFSGPMMRSILKSDYKKAIINIIESGKKYAFISCSCDGLDGRGLEEVRMFLSKYPPIAFSSRDPETYNKFKDYVPSAYNGICTAFLVNKILKIDTMELEEPYFVSSFYKNPEPFFSSTKKKPEIKDVELKGRKGLIPFVPWRINRQFEIYKKAQKNLGDLKIVRTVQQVSNRSNNFNFKYPNSYITYNPINFLSAFKGAEFTISERVHACAVTLAFGKPARLLIDSPRTGIFDRMGLTDYRQNGGYLSPIGMDEKIELEMLLLKDYLKTQLKLSE